MNGNANELPRVEAFVLDGSDFNQIVTILLHTVSEAAIMDAIEKCLRAIFSSFAQQFQRPNTKSVILLNYDCISLYRLPGDAPNVIQVGVAGGSPFGRVVIWPSSVTIGLEGSTTNYGTKEPARTTETAH